MSFLDEGKLIFYVYVMGGIVSWKRRIGKRCWQLAWLAQQR
jgi:hypothetical protein